jgi:hypothetical protein
MEWEEPVRNRSLRFRDFAGDGVLSGGGRAVTSGGGGISSFRGWIGARRMLDRIGSCSSEGAGCGSGGSVAVSCCARETDGSGRMHPEMSCPPVGNLFGCDSLQWSREYTLPGACSGTLVLGVPPQRRQRTSASLHPRNIDGRIR